MSGEDLNDAAVKAGDCTPGLLGSTPGSAIASALPPISRAMMPMHPSGEARCLCSAMCCSAGQPQAGAEGNVLLEPAGRGLAELHRNRLCLRLCFDNVALAACMLSSQTSPAPLKKPDTEPRAGLGQRGSMCGKAAVPAERTIWRGPREGRRRTLRESSSLWLHSTARKSQFMGEDVEGLVKYRELNSSINTQSRMCPLMLLEMAKKIFKNPKTLQISPGDNPASRIHMAQLRSARIRTRSPHPQVQGQRPHLPGTWPCPYGVAVRW